MTVVSLVTIVYRVKGRGYLLDGWLVLGQVLVDDDCYDLVEVALLVLGGLVAGQDQQLCYSLLHSLVVMCLIYLIGLCLL